MKNVIRVDMDRITDRYQNDPYYHSLVQAIAKALVEGKVDESELVGAVTLAMDIVETLRIRQPISN